MPRVDALLATFRGDTSQEGPRVTDREFELLTAASRSADSDAGVKVTASELWTLYQTAVEGGVPGRSVSQREIAAVNGIAEQDLDDSSSLDAPLGAQLSLAFDGSKSWTARSLYQQVVAPQMSLMRDEGARAKGVRVRGSQVAKIERVIPRDVAPRSEAVENMYEQMVHAPGSGRTSLIAHNFEIGGKPQTGLPYSDGNSATWAPGTGMAWNTGENIRRFGHQSPKDGEARITKMPADGVLHLSVMAHPSSHDGLNRHNYARRNLYRVRVTFPDGTVDLHTVRNGPMGADLPDLREPVAEGGHHEPATLQELTLDISGYPPGSRILVQMWAVGSSLGANIGARSILLILPGA